VVNDFGRPYERGFNSVSGISVRGSRGRWAFFLRGEFQEAPGAPAISTAVLDIEAAVDNRPRDSAAPRGPRRDLQLLDAYAALSFKGWQLSIGRQSLWWAPNESGSLMFSDNSLPVDMVRISRMHATALPGVLRFLGPFRGEVLFGRLSGHRFVQVGGNTIGPGLSRQPLIHGGKLNFKPTPDLDFGVSVTTILAGPKVPFTTATLVRSFAFSNAIPGQLSDPGDRRSGFDFRYRVPGVRRWLTAYGDAFAEDEISPLAYPRRSAFNLGLFMAAVPKANRLSLRGEGFYTDLPGLRGVGFLYYNFHYLNGYTNSGELMGHWIGRQGTGVMFQGTYRLKASGQAEIVVRNSHVSPQFIPMGARSLDIAARLRYPLKSNFETSIGVQRESWRVPLLSSHQESNVNTTVEFKWRPHTASVRH
jgi:hypothetical protein